jgi:hypothetical protein
MLWPRGVELIRGLRAPRRPEGDAERDADEQQEEDDGERVRLARRELGDQHGPTS